ncbi:enoyl-CoA hydratase [Microlunatus speluncae]|uniref:enoyl-CoA hydratase n=1 Tax=Microlunatus speluncae TaxID=2594267 RepID=UPI0012661C35|nr:enoyl-CoA hydratase [Microlunatus speluncae]
MADVQRGGEDEGSVRVGTGDGIAAITLNRPDRLNALTPESTVRLAEALDAASADGSVRVITITGAGRAFCAGADLAGGLEGATDELIDVLNRIATAICTAPKPVLALLNGPAVGAGASLALACDLILASSAAYLKPGFEAIGLMPDGGGTGFWTAALGRAKALQVLLLGDAIPAEEAQRLGLVAHVAGPEEFGAAADQFSRRLATGPTQAYAATKQAVNAVALSGLAQTLAFEREHQLELLRTADFAEGLTAFAEKRPPRFEGR